MTTEAVHKSLIDQPRLEFILPGDPEQRTGGYLYDAHIVSELRRQQWTVNVTGLQGRFPLVDPTACLAMSDALTRQPDQARVVIDGLALGNLPDAVEAHGQRLDISALVHHPLADETGLDEVLRERLLQRERQALGHCRRIIVTSRFSARRLIALGLTDHQASVIEPGVAPARVSARVTERLAGRDPHLPERWLCVASLTPRKGQDVLLDALARLDSDAWCLDLVGSPERDPAFADSLRQQIERLGLGSQVNLPGESDAAGLDHFYDQATLCVVPSWYEGYGMVVTEALARGLPLIATTGGALTDTVPDDAGLKVQPGDSGALSRALKRWLDDTELRLTMSRRAAAHRNSLPNWTCAGRRFAQALLAQSRPPGNREP